MKREIPDISFRRLRDAIAAVNPDNGFALFRVVQKTRDLRRV